MTSGGVTNVARHARASRAHVSVEVSHGAVVLRIEDDGCGIQGGPRPTVLGTGLGILGMSERAQRRGDRDARMWWMLRAVGHERAWVLDGGLESALGAGLQLATEDPPSPPRHAAYPCGSWQRPTIGIADLEQVLQDPGWKVLDVRARERWRGEVETLDPVAGRIPGTVNLPFAENLEPDGRFKSSAALREKYLALLVGTPPARLVVHCGSGVTACHTLLALEIAKLDGASLYVGSYSEWCRSTRPIGRG